MKVDNKKASLPYLNNIWLVIITAIINAAFTLLFYFGNIITKKDVLTDAVFCGIITAIINTYIIHYLIEKMRLNGKLPSEEFNNRWIQYLPYNPHLLMILFAIIFGIIAFLGNMLIIRFYQIEKFTLIRHTVWKSAYSCLLSAWICRFAVLRFIQKDCMLQNQPIQNGDVKVIAPLPRFVTLKNWFNTVTDDFGFNMIFGIFVGGTQIIDNNIVIPPTTLSGIVISAIILGTVVTFRMVAPVINNMYELCVSGKIPRYSKKHILSSYFPKKPFKIVIMLIIPIIMISLAVFGSVFLLFGFEELNFFQFFVIRTIYVALLSKGVVALSLWIFRQPKENVEDC